MGQADPLSEWDRQEAEYDLPDAATVTAPNSNIAIPGPISRQHQKAIAKARDVAGVYVLFDDGGAIFCETGKKPVFVMVLRCGEIILGVYFLTGQLK